MPEGMRLGMVGTKSGPFFQKEEDKFRKDPNLAHNR